MAADMQGTGSDDHSPDRGESADYRAWTDAGFDAQQAERFMSWRIGLDEAIAWCRAGVSDGRNAAQWSAAGVTPDAVNRWRTAGIEASEALMFSEMGLGLAGAIEVKRGGQEPPKGFRPVPAPGALRPFEEAGIPARVWHSYLLRQWLDEEALRWARESIDADAALLWRTMGVSPAEAGHLTRDGTAAVDAVRDWWRAGIPLDEVASWIGTGFTPEDAAELHGKGLTAAQAATRRNRGEQPS